MLTLNLLLPAAQLEEGQPQSSSICHCSFYQADVQCQDSLLQVEIKLRLPNRDAHAQVAELLKPHFRELHQQENFFFDGTSQEMSKAKLALRTRFYGVDKHAVITLKVGMQQHNRQAFVLMQGLAPNRSDNLKSQGHIAHTYSSDTAAVVQERQADMACSPAQAAPSACCFLKNWLSHAQRGANTSGMAAEQKPTAPVGDLAYSSPRCWLPGFRGPAGQPACGFR